MRNEILIYFELLECIRDSKVSYASNIARKLGKKQSTISEQVSKLVDKGLVNKINEPKFTFFELTDEGKIFLKKYRNLVNEVELFYEEWDD